MNEIVSLALDTYRGNLGEFASKEQANKTLRQAFYDIAGTDKIDYKTLRRHKTEIFEVIEEALAILVVEGITNQFDDFVEIRNLAWGDTNIFNIEDNNLFKVATIADGTGNLRRQRLDSGSITIATETKGVKIYEELYRFLAGRIDWNKMVDRVAKSYQNQIANDIYAEVYNAYDILTAPYQVSNSGVFDEAKLLTLIGHVEASTGMECVILGTKTALAKVTPAVVSDNMKDTLNTLGYYGQFKGTEMRAIKQAHSVGTQNFAINDAFLMVVPKTPDKFVKLVLEGEAFILEDAEGKKADMSIDYTFIQKAGTTVLKSAQFGIVRFV